MLPDCDGTAVALFRHSPRAMLFFYALLGLQSSTQSDWPLSITQQLALTRWKRMVKALNCSVAIDWMLCKFSLRRLGAARVGLRMKIDA